MPSIKRAPIQREPPVHNVRRTDKKLERAVSKLRRGSLPLCSQAQRTAAAGVLQAFHPSPWRCMLTSAPSSFIPVHPEWSRPCSLRTLSVLCTAVSISSVDHDYIDMLICSPEWARQADMGHSGVGPRHAVSIQTSEQGRRHAAITTSLPSPIWQPQRTIGPRSCGRQFTLLCLATHSKCAFDSIRRCARA
ncbi:hypothetical protein BDW22DRAFT_1170024 [Trametopsis cervina]|nr:hypothetical protein BDW22DRAFT_1170024 [Trametopsis cervina]